MVDIISKMSSLWLQVPVLGASFQAVSVWKGSLPIASIFIFAVCTLLFIKRGSFTVLVILALGVAVIFFRVLWFDLFIGISLALVMEIG